MTNLAHGIARTYHEEVERFVFDQRQRIEDESDILLPDMLTHKEQHHVLGRHT